MARTPPRGMLAGMTEKQRITILGAGFAGLETAFLLRAQLGEQAAITVVAERDAFTFRPNSIYVPFGADPDRLVVPLAKAFRRRQVDFVAGRVAGVDAAAREVVLDDDRRIGWDRLVIATGAGMRPEEVPGLAEHAASIWTPAAMLDVRARFAAVRDAARAGEDLQRDVRSVKLDDLRERGAGAGLDLGDFVVLHAFGAQRGDGARKGVDLVINLVVEHLL